MRAFVAALLVALPSLAGAAALPERPLVVLRPDHGPPPLLDAELELLRDAIVTRLSAVSGGKVLPADDVRRLESEVRAGARGPDGVACAAPASLEGVVAGAHPGAILVETTATCPRGEACRLVSELRTLRGQKLPERRPARFVAEVTGREGAVATWVEAAARLAVEARAGGGVGGLGLSAPEKRLGFELLPEPLATGGWTADPRPPLVEVLPALAGCLEPERGSTTFARAVLAVAADGSVREAWARAGRDAGGTPLQTCVEQRLKAARFPAADATDRRIGLRLRAPPNRDGGPFELSLAGERVPAARGGLPIDRWLLRDPSGAFLQRCWAETYPGGGEVSFETRLRIGPAGRVESAEVKPPPAAAADERTVRLAACVREALVQARFPCADAKAPPEVLGTLRLAEPEAFRLPKAPKKKR